MVSAVIFILLGIYFMLQFLMMVNKGNTNFLKNTLITDLKDETTVHYIGESGMMFGISLNLNGVEYLNDSSYFTFQFNQVNQEYVTDSSGVTTTVRTKTRIPSQECGLTSYTNIDTETIERLSVDKYF